MSNETITGTACSVFPGNGGNISPFIHDALLHSELLQFLDQYRPSFLLFCTRNETILQKTGYQISHIAETDQRTNKNNFHVFSFYLDSELTEIHLLNFCF